MRKKNKNEGKNNSNSLIRDIGLLTFISMNTMAITKLNNEIAGLKTQLKAERIIEKVLNNGNDGKDKSEAV